MKSNIKQEPLRLQKLPPATSMCLGLPWQLNGKESACQCRRSVFDPWVKKIPWTRKWQPTPVFLKIQLSEEPGRLQSTGYRRVRHDRAHYRELSNVFSSSRQYALQWMW